MTFVTEPVSARTITTVTSIPDPKLPTLYKVDGLERTLTEWAALGHPEDDPVVSA